MNIKISRFGDRFWLFYSLISFSVLYLNLIWKTTEDIDRLIIDGLFWSAIIWLLWQRRTKLNYSGNLFYSFLGVGLIGLTLFKTINLVWFENELISLIPVLGIAGLLLITSKLEAIHRCRRELLFAWILFFPLTFFEFILEKTIHISTLTAKFSTYLLYYFGFKVASQGNEVLLYLPKLGEFKATVNLPCTGAAMMLLMLKLGLLLIAFFHFRQIQQVTIVIISMGIGFISGVIRVSFLTLAIPHPAKFDYWHGSGGSQIISTLAIIVFFSFCYWMVQQQKPQQNIARISSVRSLPSGNYPTP